MTTVRIGCHSGFWGDTETAAAQLVRHGKVDYLVSDYLAEVTMSILAAQKLRNPQAGYAADFVSVMAPLVREIAEKGIKVITNAGGVNPRACRDALVKACEAAGVSLRVALVLGDDLLPRIEELRDLDLREMDTGEPLPAKITSMNAYLGGFPIARALAEGADVVITGRCVDSAVTLGALIHAFGWTMDDHDRLAAGTLCGHIIECGGQCNGGNFTDWRLVPDYDNVGFPVAEVASDGAFVLGKPDGTGGLITPATVAEQMLYEIGDPRAYIVPDVVCDFTGATYQQVGKDRVRVCGAKGRPPTDTYKVSTTWPDGYKLSTIFMLGGREAVEKGRASAEAIIKKTRRLFREKNLGDYREVSIEVIGGEFDLRPTCARSRLPRGGGEDRRQARPEGGAGAAWPRDCADVDGRRGRHDRQLRRRPCLAVASDPHVLLPGAQDAGPDHHRARGPPGRHGARCPKRRLHFCRSAGRGAACAALADDRTECRHGIRTAGGAGLRPFRRQGRQRQYRHLRAPA